MQRPSIARKWMKRSGGALLQNHYTVPLKFDTR